MKLLLGLGGRWGLAVKFGSLLFSFWQGYFFHVLPRKQEFAWLFFTFSFPSYSEEDAVLQNISSWHLSATEELMWLYFYFQPCHFKEAQLWKVVLLENPVNGFSYRNVPLSSLIMNSIENCFQSSAIQIWTNLLCITTFLFCLLLHKLSTWPMTLHPCMPRAQCKTVELWLGSSLSWGGLWGRLVQNSQ